MLEYQDTPIPSQSLTLEYKKGYRQWPIDLHDERNAEVCIDVRTQGIAGKNLYHRTDAPPYFHQFEGSVPELFVRTSVIEKLKIVNTLLAPYNAEIFVYDSWRPAPVQKGGRIWCEADVRVRFPEWDTSRVMDVVNEFWAVGPEDESDIDPLSPPPHSTGSALDLTLRRLSDEQELWMGTLVDDTTPKAHTDWYELHADDSFSDREARKNRRLLYHILTKAGFIVNPTEWWHVSWGDQMWAQISSKGTSQEVRAWYSSTNPRAH